MKQTMKLSNIIIKQDFKNSKPSPVKMAQCRENWLRGIIDRKIVVTDDNVLRDGYVLYLILKEYGVPEFTVTVEDTKTDNTYKSQETIYVFGKHPNSVNNTYVWRVSNKWNKNFKKFQLGDTIFCYTRFGISPVIVTKIEITNQCPFKNIVKRVAYKTILRNGERV